MNYIAALAVLLYLDEVRAWAKRATNAGHYAVEPTMAQCVKEARRLFAEATRDEERLVREFARHLDDVGFVLRGERHPNVVAAAERFLAERDAGTEGQG